MLNVRARAQVPPLVSHVVDRDERLRVARNDRVQDFELVRLVDRLDARPRLLLTHLLAH